MNNLINFLSKQNINSFLDIGANDGSFAQTIKNNFPNIKLFCIEANPNHEPNLQAKQLPYLIACLSDVEKNINFFISKLGDGKSTGASYYKEFTNYYSDGNYNTLILKTKTLDTIFDFNNLYEFIKLDTQGSEIDIIKGGINLVKNAKFIVVEVSVLAYNENAPLKENVFAYLNSIRYLPIEKVEEHKYADGTIFQEDWIFKNIDYKG